MSLGLCQWCGQDVIWALTVLQPRSKGGGRKRMPLDPGRLEDDDARGNVAVSRDHHGSIYARVLSKDEPDLRAGEHRAMPHFATCPSYPGRSRKPGPASTPKTAPPQQNVIPFRRRR